MKKMADASDRQLLLDDIHFDIACNNCIVEDRTDWSCYKQLPSADHACARNVLLARVMSSEKLFKIRDRAFQSRHIDCLSASTTVNPSVRCSANDLFCPFPHNDIESFLWRKEIEGQFNVFQTIVKHKQATFMNASDNVCSHFMSKYGGEIKLLCNSCPIKNQSTGSSCSEEPSHMCTSDRMLAHVSLLKDAKPLVLWMPGIEPKFFHTRKLCPRLSDCPAVGRKCHDMHSFLERDFATLITMSGATDAAWLEEMLNSMKQTKVMELERQSSLTRCMECTAPEFPYGTGNGQFVTGANAVDGSRATPRTECVAVATPERARTEACRKDARTATTDVGRRTTSESEARSDEVVANRGDTCRFKFIVICRDCWENSHDIKPYDDERKPEKCDKSHCWKDSCAVMETSGRRVLIKPLPKKLPTDTNKLQECKHNKAKIGCDRSNCQFGHSPMEVEVWKWQVTSAPRSEYRVASSVGQL